MSARPSTPQDGRARLISDVNDSSILHYSRSEDARSALARGIQEYIAGLSIEWIGGRSLEFRHVLTSWAEPEDPKVYPSAVIVAGVPMDYEDESLTPKTEHCLGGYVRSVAGCRQRFELLIWTTDPQERKGIVTMLEDALDPVDWMTGIRLELPYYFNSRATYEKKSLYYIDDADSALKRWRRAVITIVGSMPQYVPVGVLPVFVPSQKLIVD